MIVLFANFPQTLRGMSGFRLYSNQTLSVNFKLQCLLLTTPPFKKFSCLLFLSTVIHCVHEHKNWWFECQANNGHRAAEFERNITVMVCIYATVLYYMSGFFSVLLHGFSL